MQVRRVRMDLGREGELELGEQNMKIESCNMPSRGRPKPIHYIQTTLDPDLNLMVDLV